jgi:hypothetical protein
MKAKKQDVMAPMALLLGLATTTPHGRRCPSFATPPWSIVSILRVVAWSGRALPM